MRDWKTKFQNGLKQDEYMVNLRRDNWVREQVKIPRFIDKEVLQKAYQVEKLLVEYITFLKACKRFSHRKVVCKIIGVIYSELKEKVKDFYAADEVWIDDKKLSVRKYCWRFDIEVRGKCGGCVYIYLLDLSSGASLKYAWTEIEADLVDRLITSYFIVKYFKQEKRKSR